jgi:hypothetical protein
MIARVAVTYTCDACRKVKVIWSLASLTWRRFGVAFVAIVTQWRRWQVVADDDGRTGWWRAGGGWLIIMRSGRSSFNYYPRWFVSRDVIMLDPQIKRPAIAPARNSTYATHADRVIKRGWREMKSRSLAVSCELKSADDNPSMTVIHHRNAEWWPIRGRLRRRSYIQIARNVRAVFYKKSSGR